MILQRNDLIEFSPIDDRLGIVVRAKVDGLDFPFIYLNNLKYFDEKGKLFLEKGSRWYNSAAIKWYRKIG